MNEKIKILILSANPVDTGRLRLDEEIREIDEKILDTSVRDKFELISSWALRPADLQLAMLKYQPHIIHFSGHGSRSEEIVLEDDTGKSRQVSKHHLSSLFRILKDNVHIVFFDNCFSKAQAEALTGIVDYVIGTNKAIGEKAAINFAATFYQALGFGYSVGKAYELAKTELMLRGSSGIAVSELFVRKGVNPDESFLALKDSLQITTAENLETALTKLLTGTANEDEQQLVRRQLLDGRIVLEQSEEALEKDAEIIGAINKSIRGNQTIHIEVGSATYQLIQKQLYPPPPGIAPPLPDLLLVGRDDSLSDVKTLLGVNQDVAPQNNLTVVRGWPGVGKTTFVGVLGRDPEVSKAFPDGVLWTSLDQAPELISKLVEWGRALGTTELLRAHTLDDATLQLADLLHNKRMLLIVDDVWDQAHAAPFIKASVGSKCAVLITTRLTNVAEALTADGQRIYVLPVLTEENAFTLLHNLAPEVVAQHPNECRELVQDLEYLPLAIHLAGRLLKAEAKKGYDVSDLIAEIREGSKLMPEPAPLDRAEGAKMPTVTALLRSSTDQLDDRTRDCFAFLGVFAPKPATFDLAAMKAVWAIDDPKPIVRKLVGYGLLEPVGENRFQIHALLAKHALSLLS
jgi:hypothetical protein